MTKKFASIAILSSIFLTNNAMADTLNISGSQNLQGDYSNNGTSTAITVETSLGLNPPYHAVTVIGNTSANSSAYGIYAGAGGSQYAYVSRATFTGSGSETITTNNNSNSGIIANETYNGQSAELIFKNVNIVANQNAQNSNDTFAGLHANNGGHIIISSDTGLNTVTANYNKAMGLNALNSGSIISITNMSVSASNNDGNGINAGSGGTVSLSSTISGNNISVNNNKGLSGIYADAGSKIEIENMNIIASNNGEIG